MLILHNLALVALRTALWLLVFFVVFFRPRITLSQETAARIASLATLHAVDRLMQDPNFCDLARFEAKANQRIQYIQILRPEVSKNDQKRW